MRRELSPYEEFLEDQAAAHVLYVQRMKRRRAVLLLGVYVAAASCGILYWLRALSAYAVPFFALETLGATYLAAATIGPLFGAAAFGVFSTHANLTLTEWAYSVHQQRLRKNA